MTWLRNVKQRDAVSLVVHRMEAIAASAVKIKSFRHNSNTENCKPKSNLHHNLVVNKTENKKLGESSKEIQFKLGLSENLTSFSF